MENLNGRQLLQGKYQLVRLNEDPDDPIYAALRSQTANSFKIIVDEMLSEGKPGRPFDGPDGEFSMDNFMEWGKYSLAFLFFPNRKCKVELRGSMGYEKIMALLDFVDQYYQEQGVQLELLPTLFGHEPAAAKQEPFHIECPHCHARFQFVSELGFDKDECVSLCPECGAMIEDTEPET